MRLVDEIPVKLLDCPEVEIVSWPDGFERIGHAMRIDYTTEIHGGPQSFSHVFCTSSVNVFTPSLFEGELWAMESAYSPISFGVLDRIVVAVKDDENVERIVVYERAGLADAIDEDVDETLPLPPALLAWDPEHKQLVAVAEDGIPVAVLAGGFLALDSEAMILG